MKRLTRLAILSSGECMIRFQKPINNNYTNYSKLNLEQITLIAKQSDVFCCFFFSYNQNYYFINYKLCALHNCAAVKTPTNK